MTKIKNSALVDTAAYQKKSAEIAVIEKQRKRRKEKPTLPYIRVEPVDAGSMTVTIEHPEPATGHAMIMSAFGTASSDFFDGVLQGVLNACGPKVVTSREANFVAAAMAEIAPQDGIEAMLASQMLATHTVAMDAARRMHMADTLPKRDHYEKTFTKATRTFATQVETLKRHRTGGEQKVTVQHVTVADGGQAVIGAVTAGGGLTKKDGSTP